MSPQQSLRDPALDTCRVFVGTPASAQEWQVNQLDGNPLISVGFGRVGQLKKLARGSAKGRSVANFMGSLRFGYVGHMDHGMFETVAVEGFAAWTFHQGTRLLRRKLLTGFPHRIFPRCPIPLVAPLLKVCLSGAPGSACRSRYRSNETIGQRGRKSRSGRRRSVYVQKVRGKVHQGQ